MYTIILQLMVIFRSPISLCLLVCKSASYRVVKKPYSSSDSISKLVPYTQILIIMQGCGHKNSKFGTLGKKSRNKKGETNNNNKIKKINQITTIQFTYGSKLMSFFEGGNTLTRTLSKSAPST